MPVNNPQTIPDRVPSSLSEDYREHFSKEFASHIANEDFRERVKKIFEECTDSVSFMDKVKGYAGREIDERIFKNGKAIFIYIASIAIAGIVGAVIAKYIH